MKSVAAAVTPCSGRLVHHAPAGDANGQSYYGFDDDEDDDSDLPYDPRDWDEPEDDERFDPEPLDDDIWNDFDVGEDPQDEDLPPDELWTDSDWE